mmetsp:Transcript_8403/g.18849  ORF Transcript_8403/g.18849 Transcript_8403/m.18849 type:complete len:214 (+) Transcript_8403:913-1554(+)
MSQALIIHLASIYISLVLLLLFHHQLPSKSRSSTLHSLVLLHIYILLMMSRQQLTLSHAVPTSPRFPTLRHEVGIRMDVHYIVSVFNLLQCPEKSSINVFSVPIRFENFQCLRRMTRKHHMIKHSNTLISIRKQFILHSITTTTTKLLHTNNLHTRMSILPQNLRHLPRILNTPPLGSLILRPIEQLQHFVIAHEFHQRRGRKIHDIFNTRTP